MLILSIQGCNRVVDVFQLEPIQSRQQIGTAAALALLAPGGMPPSTCRCQQAEAEHGLACNVQAVASYMHDFE
jgi:hypothetical protein